MNEGEEVVLEESFADYIASPEFLEQEGSQTKMVSAFMSALDKTDYTSLRVGCICHAINLCVKDSIKKSDSMLDILKRIKKVVKKVLYL